MFTLPVTSQTCLHSLSHHRHVYTPSHIRHVYTPSHTTDMFTLPVTPQTCLHFKSYHIHVNLHLYHICPQTDTWANTPEEDIHSPVACWGQPSSGWCAGSMYCSAWTGQPGQAHTSTFCTQHIILSYIQYSMTFHTHANKWVQRHLQTYIWTDHTHTLFFCAYRNILHAHMCCANCMHAFYPFISMWNCICINGLYFWHHNILTPSM